MTKSITKTVAILLATFGLGTLVSACGDGSDMGVPSVTDGGAKAAPVSEAVARFKGTWVVSSGEQRIACGGTSTSVAVIDNVTWTEGADADLAQQGAHLVCPIHADVTGATAQGRTVTCPLSFEDGTTGTYTIASYAFVLDPSGLTASEVLSGSVTETNGGSSFTCSHDRVASYRKVGR